MVSMVPPLEWALFSPFVDDPAPMNFVDSRCLNTARGKTFLALHFMF